MISVSGIEQDVLLWCLSTDTLPTAAEAAAAGKVSKVPNGALAYQMDTKKILIYDRENDTWRAQN